MTDENGPPNEDRSLPPAWEKRLTDAENEALRARFEEIQETAALRRRLAEAEPAQPLIHLGAGLDVYGTWQGWAALCGALAEAQQKFAVPTKDKEVRIETRTGGAYTFKYATMAELKRCTDKPLAEHGLSVLQPPSRPETATGEIMVTTMLVHESGTMLVTKFALSDQSSIKDLGGNLTYIQRYQYSKILNLSGDEDADDLPDTSRGEVGAESRQRTQSPKTPQQTREKASPRARDAQPAPQPERKPDPPYSDEERAKWEMEQRAGVDARNAANKAPEAAKPSPETPPQAPETPDRPPPPADSEAPAEDYQDSHVEPDDGPPSEELNWEIRNLLQALGMRAADTQAFVEAQFGCDVAELKGSRLLAERLRDALKDKLGGA